MNAMIYHAYMRKKLQNLQYIDLLIHELIDIEDVVSIT